jgi:glycosyl transferase family 25
LFILKILSILFPKVVCINLDRRPDRWRRMQEKFLEHDIVPVRRFSAVDGSATEIPALWNHSPGAYGCLLSHIAVVKEAQSSGAPSVLIFEDDAVFDPDFQNKLAGFIQEVPADWDMLYFGALHKDEPVRISDHVARITKANSTYAYAIRNTMFDEFIELNRRAEHVIDMNSYLLQERFNCYCFMPNLAWVEAEYSDVQNRLERHWYLERSLVLFGAQVDRLLSQTTIVIAHNGVPDAKNLAFLTRYYEEYFSPLIEIVVVERNFNTGIALSNAKRNFFILSDSNLYLEALDIRANLRMCEAYDATTGFSELIDLDHYQAGLLRKTGITRGIDLSKNPSSKNTSIRFCNRRVLEAAGGWRENNWLEPARVFPSPNHALRLPCD